MDFPKKPRALAYRQKLVFALAISFLGFGNALAADLAYPQRVPTAAPRVAVQNPWCRILPGPHRDLVGDTNFFRPMAVCYSAGVLADSYDYGDREPKLPQPFFGEEILKLFGIRMR